MPPEWREYFEGLNNGAPVRSRSFRPSFERRGIFGVAVGPEPGAGEGELEPMLKLQHRVDRMIRAYRVRGHMQAKIDPLSDFVPYVPQLDPEYYGFSLEDMNRRFVSETMQPEGRLTLNRILRRLRTVYCGSVGAQYMQIDDLQVRHWIQKQLEGMRFKGELSRRQQLRILTRLTDATVFEQFLRRKFVGAKSFSLEGAESLIPLLDLAIERASQQGV